MGISKTAGLIISTAVLFPSLLLASNDVKLSTKKAEPVVQVEPKKDFIVGIFRPMKKSYHSKVAMLEDLDLLVVDEKNVGNLTEAFRQIEQSNLLNVDEKIEWIKKNQASLPPPFLALLASYLAPTNTNEAAKWYVVSSIRSEIDNRKCTEKETTREGNELIFEKVVENLQQVLKGNDDQEKMASFSNSIKSQFENAVSFHKANPYKIQHPYWLSNHATVPLINRAPGVDVIIKENEILVDPFKDTTFKPENQWKTIEESVIYQLRKELS